ncbi:hypothetical protein JCM11491_005527 [Sporobolomyces phaffii]
MAVLKTGLGERLVSSDVEAKAFDVLPVIDLADLGSPDVERRKALAEQASPSSPVLVRSLTNSLAARRQIQRASIEIGFFYISNHGIDQDVIDDAFEQGRQFFAQPTEKKMLVDLQKSDAFKGYAPLKGENVDPASRGDVHEAFDIGDDSQVFKSGTRSGGNLWPPAEDLPAFRPAIERAFSAVMHLGKRLLPLFALALDLPEDHFSDQTRNPGSTFRVLSYPPQVGEVDLKEIGIGAHQDYELYTILAQHGDVEALQVLNADGEWVHAPPRRGTFVVNIGDQLERLTNGIFKSTVHRAINRSGVSRMSMPFFFGLDYDANLSVLPNCISESRPALYEPILAGEYVEKRLAETYVRVDDTNVDDNADTGAIVG